jgi:hypothetical protein
MIMLSVGLAAAIRIGLVVLFLPFSALDKVLNFRAPSPKRTKRCRTRPSPSG